MFSNDGQQAVRKKLYHLLGRVTSEVKKEDAKVTPRVPQAALNALIGNLDSVHEIPQGPTVALTGAQTKEQLLSDITSRISGLANRHPVMKGYDLNGAQFVVYSYVEKTDTDEKTPYALIFYGLHAENSGVMVMVTSLSLQASKTNR